jgi:formiminoglutamase
MPLQQVQGNNPLILALPYSGSDMIRAIVQRLDDPEAWYTAPDRYLDRLVRDVIGDANLLRASFHRYLSDVDHPLPNNGLKPRQGMIGVVPLLNDDGAQIWQTPPTGKEATSWCAMYYAPYHAALATQIARVRARFGHVILVNCRACPERNAGRPDAETADVTLSTYVGAACNIGLSSKLAAFFASVDGYSSVLNGRMSTGWTTRHYGRAASGIHAFDLELNESCYLNPDPGNSSYDPVHAAPLQNLLAEALEFLAEWRPN